MHALAQHPAFQVPLTCDTAVIACHFSPCGYLRPRQNLVKFLDRLAVQGVPVFMAELTYGDDAPFLPECDRVLHLRTDPDNLLFHKENLINLAERIVPDRFTRLVWMDAECLMQRKTWLAETSEELDYSAVVQPWKRAILTDRNGKETRVINSVGYGCDLMDPRAQTPGSGSPYHPGFATAARRGLWTQHSGLLELPTGCSDTAMATAMLSRLTVPASGSGLSAVSAETWAHIAAWSARVHPWCGGTMGSIPGDVVHLWHGEIDARDYPAQMSLLSSYIPARHTHHRADGLLEWTDAARAEIPDTIATIADLFHSRREDG